MADLFILPYLTIYLYFFGLTYICFIPRVIIQYYVIYFIEQIIPIRPLRELSVWHHALWHMPQHFGLLSTSFIYDITWCIGLILHIPCLHIGLAISSKSSIYFYYSIENLDLASYYFASSDNPYLMRLIQLLKNPVLSFCFHLSFISLNSVGKCTVPTLSLNTHVILGALLCLKGVTKDLEEKP